MQCGVEGCTGYHGRDVPYRAQCPRTRGAHTSRGSKVKYNQSIKGAISRTRYDLKRKGASVETD
jgi:hypothetical protein